MVVEITEEYFIQAMWEAYPHNLSTDGLRAIWDYLEEKDSGEVFTPEFINDYFSEYKIHKYTRWDLEEIRSNPEFIVINDENYIKINI